jgi:hypothetical protein
MVINNTQEIVAVIPEIGRVTAKIEDLILSRYSDRTLTEALCKRIINNFPPIIENIRGGIEMIWQIIANIVQLCSTGIFRAIQIDNIFDKAVPNYKASIC